MEKGKRKEEKVKVPLGGFRGKKTGKK